MLRITFVVFVMGLVAMVSSSKEDLTQKVIQRVIKKTGNTDLAEGDEYLYRDANGLAEGCGTVKPGADGIGAGTVISRPGTNADDAIKFAQRLARKIGKTASSVACDAFACPDGNVYGACAFE